MGKLRPPLHDQRGGSTFDRVPDEAVTVGLGSTQREEHAPCHHLTGIGVVARERVSHLGAAELAAAGGLEDLEERQLHVLNM